MIGNLVKDIGRDLKTIAVDELELARGKLTDYLEQLVAKAATVLLGAVVAMVGFGMLCVVVVVALAPVIEPLWIRLLIMAVAYLVVGAGVVHVFSKRLANVKPALDKQFAEVGETIDAVKNGLAS